MGYNVALADAEVRSHGTGLQGSPGVADRIAAIARAGPYATGGLRNLVASLPASGTDCG